MQPDTDLHAATRRLARDATLVGLLPAVVLGVVAALLLHPVAGALAAILGALAWVLLVRRRIAGASERMARSVGARPLGPGAAPRVENLLEGLCLTSGVAPPHLWMVESPGLNAMVAAAGERVDVVVTRGLVDGLDRLELEGVLANLLGRVRDGTASHLTLLAALLGDSGPARARRRAGLGEQWQVRSDLAAVDLTRYPPGLRAALSHMAGSGTEVPGVPAATTSSWLADPDGAGREDAPALDLRIAVLSEL
jgi:hypothetical protein